ncbi:AAA family ATPase [Sorangium sp. So ce1078]|uniref:AAA family ATPase n=1 Tax=Sorangium sp. So ce1078 TaxID=3133329 RepID=UPI003F5F1E63
MQPFLDTQAPPAGLPLAAPMDMPRFLPAAARLSLSLAELHKDGGIHGRLSPRSLLIGDGGDPLRIVAPQSSADDREHLVADVFAHPELFPYISPEITGRINRPVDHRADLYSLGAIFYEMISGAPPFQANDLLEWTHCHVARRPRPLTEVAPATPPLVSDIVLKLLAKMPDERYRTARGLAHDLERCVAALRETGRVAPFTLGAQDTPDRFQIPRTLLGRDREVLALTGAFEQVLSTGTPALALVTGHSGIGKSSLVSELLHHVVRARGAFVSGKCDQYKRGIPYSTFTQAFGELVRRLLTESEARLDAWRTRLLEALGRHGHLIIDVIPRVELILGRQPPVERLPMREAENRFVRTFQQFVGVLATRDHPLVLFLDDLQWADAASIRLLRRLLEPAPSRPLLIVGAYRDGEVGRSHALTAVVEELTAAGVPVHRVPLGPLAAADVRDLVAATLSCDPATAQPLAERVHLASAGNPLLSAQALTTLHRTGLVRFDGSEGAWRWDLAEIDAKGPLGGTSDLSASALDLLSREARTALRLGACIGDEFDIATLALLAETPEEALREHLREAAREEIVRLGQRTCAFAHDRVRQAAYALIPEEMRAAEHLRIGRLLLSAEAPGQSVFDVASQMNLGAPLIRERDERTRVAELNLAAGRKAKSSAAYRPAADYLAAGTAMLAEDCWETQYELAYALHLERAECAQQNGDLDEAERLCTLLLSHAKTLLHKAPVYRVKIEIRTSRFSPDTMPCILECLSALGVGLPERPSDADVEAAFDTVWRALGDRSIESLRELPPMADPESQAVMSTLAVTYVATWFMDENVAHLTASWMVHLSMTRGNADASALAYGGFGMSLVQRFGDYKNAYRFSKLAHELAEDRGSIYFLGVAADLHGVMISPWVRPLPVSLEIIKRGLGAAIESGNLIFSAFLALGTVTHGLVRGEPLEELYRASEARMETVRAANFAMAERCLVIIQRFIKHMMGQTSGPLTFSGDDFDEAAFAEQLEDGSSPLAALWYHVLRLQARFLVGDLEEASRAAASAQEMYWASVLQILVPDVHCYTALTLAASPGDPGEPGRRREALAIHEARLRGFAEGCPENFSHKHALIQAEIARIEDRALDAMRLYERAISAAREGGFVHDEGVCAEIAARFYMARGATTAGLGYLRVARACYARWGAALLVDRLDQRYPELCQAAAIVPPRAADDRTRQLDTLAVVRALQAISSEIVLDKLLSNLLRVVIEHAAAERCHLLLVQEGQFTLLASACAEQAVEIQRLAEGGSLPPDGLPMSIVSYVKRTGEHVILDDASEGSHYAYDAYIARRRTKSACCVPITRQKTLTGILYLENDLTSGAFKADRLALLDLVAKQAAISVENALLYEGLARENGERKRVEGELREQLEIVGRQEDAIRALSTPIIEVWDGVVTMPIFGSIDGQRAAQIMDVLLTTIARKGCRFAILDLTGVEVVDTVTAHHVISVIRAVELLGARGMVVGIRPEVAQTIVSAGADLTRIRTLGNLRQALQVCMRASRR